MRQKSGCMRAQPGIRPAAVQVVLQRVLRPFSRPIGKLARRAANARETSRIKSKYVAFGRNTQSGCAGTLCVRRCGHDNPWPNRANHRAPLKGSLLVSAPPKAAAAEQGESPLLPRAPPSSYPAGASSALRSHGRRAQPTNHEEAGRVTGGGIFLRPETEQSLNSSRV